MHKNKFDVEMALARAGECRSEWVEAHRQYRATMAAVMHRLLHEAAINRMSVDDVSRLTGITRSEVRSMMKAAGLNPRKGKSLLSKEAAAAVQANAEILGVEPFEVDLTSPLAYLPMGEAMKARIIEGREADTPLWADTL